MDHLCKQVNVQLAIDKAHMALQAEISINIGLQNMQCSTQIFF